MRESADDPGAGPTFEEIKQRAYDLWDRNHRPDGFEVRFWLMAERELKAERKEAAAPRSLILVSSGGGRTASDACPAHGPLVSAGTVRRTCVARR